MLEESNSWCHFENFISSSSILLCQLFYSIAGVNSKEIDEEAAKEWEHTMLQNTMGKELNELNKRLEQKEVILNVWWNKVLTASKVRFLNWTSFTAFIKNTHEEWVILKNRE